MKRILQAAYRIRGPLYVGAVLLLLATVATSVLDLGPAARAVRGIVSLGALVVFVLCILLVVFGPRLMRTPETVVVGSPVRGRWLAMNSPASKVPSHGVRMYGQAYAIDLVAEPDEVSRPVFGAGSPAMRAAEQYPAFGEPVHAMVDGTVVRAAEARRDHRARSNAWGIAFMMIEGAVREMGGPGFILGNHVTIRTDDGRFALVAHLRRRSLTVRVGDRVRAGQQIGLCGNSGNSSEPHVHAQLMDRVSPLTAQGIPIAFAGIRVNDAARADGLPANGEHLVAD